MKSAVWPVRGNRTFAEWVQRNIEQVGMPDWNDEEQTLARALHTPPAAPPEGLRPAVRPLGRPAKMIMASNDCGDVSWKVSMARLWLPGNVPGASYHHWTAGAALATSIDDKGAVAGAKALASSVPDCLTDSTIVEEAKRIFAD